MPDAGAQLLAILERRVANAEAALGPESPLTLNEVQQARAPANRHCILWKFREIAPVF